MKSNFRKYALFLILAVSASHGYASESLNCTLKKAGPDQAATKMTLDPKNFSYKAQLDSVSAEVGFYYFANGLNEAIESMTLTDNRTGISSSFLHNAECASNQCPAERLDIKTGWHQLDLGDRGIYQIWCTLH